MDPLHAGLLQALELPAAVEHLSAEAPGLIPSHGLDLLLSYSAAEWTDWASAQLRAGFQIERQPTITVPKRGGGYRPLTPLGPLEVTLYTALVQLLRPSLPAIERTHEAYESFVRAPLEVGDVSYVVVADVVGYHDAVDHGLLLREIVELTGQWDAPSATVSLLNSVMQREFGLPQLYWASDQLAECVVDVVRRRLVRAGYPTFRYSDDFRVALPNWRAAQRAVETLYEELRSLGLILNEAKTLTLTDAHYAEWVREPAELWAQIVGELEVDEEFFPALYEVDDPVVERQLQSIGEDAGRRALLLWSDPEALESSQISGLRGRFLIGLATLGLRTLGQVESSAGLKYARMLLTHAPGVTRDVAWYLARTARHDPGGVESQLRSLLTRRQRPYLMEWQEWWLLDVIRQLPEIGGLAAWLRRTTEGARSPYVRAYSALVRAKHGLINPGEIAEQFEVAPQTARLDLAIAAGLLAEDVGGGPTAAIVEEGPPYSWLARTAHLLV